MNMPRDSKFWGRDTPFAQEMQAVLGVGFDDFVTVTATGAQTKVCLSALEGNCKLVLIFNGESTKARSVTPVLIFDDQRIAPWVATPLDSAAVIRALDSLWFRRIEPPTGRMH